MSDDVTSVLGEAQRALTRQEASFETIRTRVATVFSASGIAAALFAGRFRVGIPAHHLLVVIAALLVLVGTGATVVVLLPRGARFSENLSLVLEQVAPGESPQRPEGWGAQRAALGIYQMLDGNRRSLRLVTWAYATLCVSFGLQVGIWLLVSVTR